MYHVDSAISHQIENEFQNDFTGETMTVLARSQQGVPLGVYTGNDVSTFAAKDIPNSTALLIDGKRLFLYRVEFSIYETSLLGDPGTLDKHDVSDSPAAAVVDPESGAEASM